MQDLVTILGVTRNLEDYVERSIDSALNQTYSYIQIIFVDDHSSDETWKKMQKYKSRVTLIRQKKRGYISTALNTALKHAKGEYIVRLDGDDKMYPALVEKEVNFLKKHPQVGYVSCDYHVVNDVGIKIKKPELKEYSPDNIYHVDMTAVGTMLRRECFDKVGWFDPQMHLQEMYEFYLRLSKVYQGGYIAEKLWAYTRRPDQATSESQRTRFMKYTTLAIEKNFKKELVKITE